MKFHVILKSDKGKKFGPDVYPLSSHSTASLAEAAARKANRDTLREMPEAMNDPFIVVIEGD